MTSYAALVLGGARETSMKCKYFLKLTENPIDIVDIAVARVLCKTKII